MHPASPARGPAVLLSVLFTSACFQFIALAPRAAAASDPWTGHAVIVGVSDYEEISDLYLCDDDAEDMRETLLLDAEHWFDSNIELLLDSDATADEILAAIGRMETAAAGDVCLFFFSGHGGTTDDLDGDETASGDDEDETLLAYDARIVGGHIVAGHVLDDQLSASLSDFTTQRVCVIIDTCYAGGMAKSVGGMSPSKWLTGMAEDIAGARSPKASKSPAARRKDLDDLVSVNVVALMSCEDVQTSDEDFILRNGVFTFFVLEAMCHLSTDTNADTFCSAEEIFAYAAPKTVSWNPEQTPLLFDADSDELSQVPLLAAGERDVERIVTVKDLPFGGGIEGGCAPSRPGPVGGVSLVLLAALGVIAGRRRTAALVLILLAGAGCSQVYPDLSASPAHAPERYVPIEAAAGRDAGQPLKVPTPRGPGARPSEADGPSVLPVPARRQAGLSWGVRAGLVAPLGPLELTSASYSQTVQVGLFAAARLWRVPFEIGADVYRIRSPNVPVAADVLSGRLDVMVPGGLTPEGRELYYHFGPRVLVDFIESDSYWDGMSEVVAALGVGAGVRRPSGRLDVRMSVDWLLGSSNIAGLLSVNVGLRF